MTEIFYDKNAEVDKDGEKQDLGVYEARRLIGPQSFDDTWQLIGLLQNWEMRKIIVSLPL